MKKKKENKKNIVKEVAKKASKPFTLLLILLSIVTFIVCYKLFGIIIAGIFTFLFLITMLLSQILDLNPKSSKKRKIVKGIFILAIIFGIIGIISVIGFFIYVISKAPDFDVTKLGRKETTIIYDNKNQVITTLGLEKREKVEYNELPEVLVDALIATEDSRFFQHNGFDAPRFIKATLELVTGKDGGGASTLTMQVSKNNFTSKDVDIIRKFIDIYISVFKIEKAFTKQEIIEYYVNEPFLGNSSYGVEQAAQTYFGKSVGQLNLSEASLIIGMLQAPSAYDPFEYPEEATARRADVLSLMRMHGYITKEQEDIANAIPVSDLIVSSDTRKTNEFQDYLDAVIQEVTNKYGLDPYNVPMIIYTNMDRSKQQAMNNVMSGKSFKWFNKTIQGSAAAIDVHSGKVIAIGGGRNRKGERTFNYATDIDRQIGSTAKPLFDYGPGIEYNNWSTAQTFDDSRWTYSDGSSIYNFDMGYMGKITLRTALRESRNIPALKAFQQTDNKKIKEFVTKLGIIPEEDADGRLHEAHSIGAFNGIHNNPVYMAAAYAAFANGGYYYEPYTVNKIILRETDEEIPWKSEKVKVMSDSTAYMIASVLQGVAADTGVSSVVDGQVAVKTGTTNYDSKTRSTFGYPYEAAPDGWMCGFTPDISLAIWTGYVKNVKGQYITMSQMREQRNGLYKASAKAVFNKKGSNFVKPSSVVSITVERGSDPIALPSAGTPSNMKVTELFKRGTEPTEISNRYRPLDNATDLEVSYTGGTIHLSWNRVIQPSDIKVKDFGNFGYRVYKNGSYIGFTSENYYDINTSSPYGTYTVRTAYSKVTSNMSSGVTVSLSSNITFKFNECSNPNVTACTVYLSVGDTYAESVPSVSVFDENMIDVSSMASYSKTITKSPNDIVSSVTTSSPATFVIKYTVSYGGETKTFTKTVNIN